jgi:SAM-dependent methyltransferase
LTPFWHPLSAILLAEPRCLASPRIVRMFLAAQGEVSLVYAGDRMSPSVRHGATFAVAPVDPRGLREGDIVVTCEDGIPDLMRVSGNDAGALRVAADADPEEAGIIEAAALLARARLPSGAVSPRRRRLRRILADLREAALHGPDSERDAAESVRDKYDGQAAFYERSPAEDLEASLASRIRGRLPAGGRLLVVGSGTGRECFALAAAGWQVTGLDFAPAMVEVARREAARRGAEVEFVSGDVRSHRVAPGSLSGVVFTYDVYSFVPQQKARVELLRAIHDWLAPGGAVFLSARKLHSAYQRLILTLQWLAQRRRSDLEWGDSHTRWISGEGRLGRSFVHYFTDAQLRYEIAGGGFILEEWRGGHGVLRPLAAVMIPRRTPERVAGKGNEGIR